jgi:hypothetical protein
MVLTAGVYGGVVWSGSHTAIRFGTGQGRGGRGGGDGGDNAGCEAGQRPSVSSRDG